MASKRVRVRTELRTHRSEQSRWSGADGYAGAGIGAETGTLAGLSRVYVSGQAMSDGTVAVRVIVHPAGDASYVLAEGVIRDGVVTWGHQVDVAGRYDAEAAPTRGRRWWSTNGRNGGVAVDRFSPNGCERNVIAGATRKVAELVASECADAYRLGYADALDDLAGRAEVRAWPMGGTFATMAAREVTS